MRFRSPKTEVKVRVQVVPCNPFARNEVRSPKTEVKVRVQVVPRNPFALRPNFSWTFLRALPCLLAVSTALSKFCCDRVQPLLLAASGRIGAALAAPYCSKHSKAHPTFTWTSTCTHTRVHRWPPFEQLAVEESAAIHNRSRAWWPCNSGESINVHDI